MSADDCAAIIESTKSAVAALGDENGGGGGSSYQAFLRIKVRGKLLQLPFFWIHQGSTQCVGLRRPLAGPRRCRATDSTGRFRSGC